MNLLKLKRIFYLVYVFNVLKVYSTGLQTCEDCTSNPCDVNTYCFDGTNIKSINNGIPGSVKFGKGASSGSIFFNDDSKLLKTDNDGSIGSIYTCSSSGCSYVDDTSKTYFNSIASGISCIINDNNNCKKGEANESYYDNYSKRVINCSASKCLPSSVTGYYIDYGTDPSKMNYLITCINNSCTTELHSGTEVEFYLDGLDKTSQPIIYFDGKFSKIPGNVSGVYLDSETKSGSNLIVCESTTKCVSLSYNEGIFLNAANLLDKTKSSEQLIVCSSTGCIGKEISSTDTNNHANYFVDGLTKKLIQCSGTTDVSCEIVMNNISNKYYLDYATPSSSCSMGSSFCSANVIYCNNSSRCVSSLITSESYFIDGDSAENLIICNTFDSKFLCTTVPASNLNNYYINSGSNGEYPLIYCGDSTTTSCAEKKASTSGYYIPDIGTFITSSPYNLDFNGHLISCSSTDHCEIIYDAFNEGYYINAGVDNTNKPLIYLDNGSNLISEQYPNDKDSYYVDSSSSISNSFTHLIYCSTLNNCTSFDPEDGYFLNSGSFDGETNVIISCDKTGCKFDSNVQLCTVEEEKILKPGNYCYRKKEGSDTDINFVIKEFAINSEDISDDNKNITYTTSFPVYHYIPVSPNNFPGINKFMSTLFEVKSNSITRVNSNGIYIINNKNEKVDSINYNGLTLYICSSYTQLCTPYQSCKRETYLYDETSGKGYYCFGTNLSVISEAGYYIDYSYVDRNGKTPSIIKCQSTGNCERFTPKTNTYFINSGFDNYSKALIHCENGSCTTQEATPGYYVAEFNQSGVINCVTRISCKLSPLRYNYYINSGSDKSIYPIIYCIKGVKCNSKRAYSGYYLVHENNDLIINCKSSNSCLLEKASAGYYYNAANHDVVAADVETVIKCYSSSYTDKIICNSERKNEGFYLWKNNNNVLIDCMGSRCKTIVVDTGVFHSASNVKKSNLVSSKGRDEYNEDDENLLVNHKERFDYDDDLDNINKKDENINEEVKNIHEKYNELNMEESNNLNDLPENELNERTNSESEKEVQLSSRTNTEDIVSTIIICNKGICNELTVEELKTIPICSYIDDLCYVDNSGTNAQTDRINVVASGEFCTDNSRSTLYFALETIVEYNDVISGVLSTSKIPSKNCIKVSSQYSNNFFTIGNNIYRVDQGLIKQITDVGYYFINISKNELIHGNDIKEYNKSDVLLYKCDGNSCRIMDKPESNTYYSDVSKRIIKYSVEEDKYFYLNARENICTFFENTCTPKYDISENDFCLTAEGNLVVAGEKIKSRETGKCYMSSVINENVLAYSSNSVLYLLNSNAAIQLTTTGYYFAENNKYYSAEYRTFNDTRAGVTLYGCFNNACKVYEPQPNIYYFDMLTNYLIQKKDKVWISPNNVGYIYASVNPNEECIFSYIISSSRELLLAKTNKNGWYYTIDKKMYKCNNNNGGCTEIDDTAYVLTVDYVLYYCVVDSEGEETECFRKTCNIGEIYYIENQYYKCVSGSYYEPIRSKTCEYDEVVIINFPLIYSEFFPTSVYKTINNIAKNNKYLPTEKKRRSDLEVIQGVFTNCTYNSLGEYTEYDQICMANYVKMNEDNEPDICSIKLLGYTYCTVEEGDNPNKCDPSSASLQKYLSSWHIVAFIISLIIYFIMH
ncbi:hypothetical protein H8356DRAFT_1424886 [Neocallimastix lanati (nom. inval.)]|nr:hypothetical protein H8356DRAFT_1424886 [Neocallimastix sp. JGI-2020a]